MVGRKTLNQFEFFVDLPRFDKAKCATVEDKDMFFPDNRTQEAERLHQLKAICESCIHEKECLEYALEKQIPFGIWGGTTPLQRNDMLPNVGLKKGFVGIGLAITQLHKKGVSANEIAIQLNTSSGYIKRVLRKLKATEQGAEPLHQQIKDSSEGLR
jgi:WhiB family redox-sensing transcriptional regulator